ncbi:hypothetical protein LTR56_011372 [Elasticomyces elasticus]|nr:hypothetical protein LTR56_011372 [Elasticomyces elasticus]KAK3660974.1 hypothetical protein LTR22_007802 [Elasticomyces elasticus]KAK4932381.1 hypothetical protein LTR49_001250 [Elasticomyces elasticus]KAK5768389.1 hypothetical protein LTS12_001528 [Elasticomyces elasticus]
MRLLNVDNLDFKEFRDEDAPPYVAASHRWLNDGETTYQDAKHRRSSAGYQKVEAFAKYIRKELAPIRWLWIDTACINKESAAELSEAINSMFEWYRGAQICLAYLADVNSVSTIASSVWWKRGWTLQELLAPRLVLFVTKEWHVIGHKGCSTCGECQPILGSNLEKSISGITRIPEPVLHDHQASHTLSVHEKLKWMEGRETSRPEDMSYALFGILDVTLPVIYGERYKGARERLLAAIRERENVAAREAEYHRTIADWLAPSDPWTNHQSARQRHEPDTGAWLLHHKQYLAWKSGASRLLWVYGKAGCGKTVLCSTAVEDMQTHCQNAKGIGHAIFYFSFSDNCKQTYLDLLVSVVVQLSKEGPGWSMLRQVYERPERRQPGSDELRKILSASLASYGSVFIHVDALDECPDTDEVRRDVLDGLEELLEQAPNSKVLVTSRDIPEVRSVMEKLESEMLSIEARMMDADIQKYVSTQLLRDHKLSRLDHATIRLIEETLAQKADGMFRWVYCQLQLLKQTKSSRPSSIRTALRALPIDLDETYERMLNRLTPDDRQHAITLLRWLAYAKSPLSLEQLAEASIVDPTDDPTADDIVDIEDKGSWEDTFELLAGLVIPHGALEGDVDNRTFEPDSTNKSRDDLRNTPPINKDTKLKLAHFSVKEYLESSRILISEVREFHLHPAREHRFITQSCLVYLMHYSSSRWKTSTEQDLMMFPLLRYAAETWPYHASLQTHESSDREVSFLCPETRRRDWLLVYDPDEYESKPFASSIEFPGTEDFEEDPKNTATPLYYASLLGLVTVARQLLLAGADPNLQGGKYNYESALHAASSRGFADVVQLLLCYQADVNAQGRSELKSTALQAATSRGYTDIMQLLLENGADVNAWDQRYDNVLQAAARSGHAALVQLVLDRHVDVNARAPPDGCALQAAALQGHQEVVQLLLNHGAHINALVAYSGPREEIGTALHAASSWNRKEVVQVLLDRGADINAERTPYDTALQAAAYKGHVEIVQLMLGRGAHDPEDLAMLIASARRPALGHTRQGSHDELPEYSRSNSAVPAPMVFLGANAIELQ